ncbi:MAG: hypothetical protein CMO01_14505 [Thalassobius sp.]|nr:hypothetical protein [Thalassovita sp.]
MKFYFPKQIHILLISFIIFSCAEEESKISSFLEYKGVKLTHEVVEVENLAISGYNQIIYVNNYLVFLEKQTEVPIHILKLNTNKLVASILVARGSRGNGPYQLNRPHRLNISNKPGCFDIYDTNRKSILTYNVDSLYEDEKYVPEITKMNENGFAMEALLIKDSTFISTGSYEEGRYKLTTNDKARYFFEYPNDRVNVMNSKKAWAYQGTLRYDYKSNKVFSACFMGFIVDILEYKNGELRLVYKNEENFPEYKTHAKADQGAATSPKEKNTFQSLCTSNENVYYLYSGKSFLEHKQSASMSNEIWVSDKEGRFVNKYYLDVDAYGMAVDDKGENLYTVGFVDDDLKLLKFNIE